MKVNFRRLFLAVFALPVMVLAVLPALLLLIWPKPMPTFNQPAPYIGIVFFVGGLVIIIWTVSLFARIGRGTLAPWDPPEKLVIEGPYRYIRNPMIAGVVIALAGECLFFLSLPLVFYTFFVVIANLFYFPFSEEKGLEARFGDAYLEYKSQVPRFFPRLRFWGPDDQLK